MTDARTLAYINLFAVLGAIPYLCQLDNESAALIEGETVSVGFSVKDGPKATLFIGGGKARMAPGVDRCQVLLPFSSCEKFNGLIDGTVTPIPSKGFTKIGFLLKDFTKLTDLLNKYMRPDPADLENEEFFNISTQLMLYTISVAIAQIGNNDAIGKFSAQQMVDGEIGFSIKGGPAATIRVKNHRLLAIKQPCESPRAVMEFDSIKLARDLFDGKVNAIACVGSGDIVMKGMISMLDNLNRILDRVALYLA